MKSATPITPNTAATTKIAWKPKASASSPAQSGVTNTTGPSAVRASPT